MRRSWTLRVDHLPRVIEILTQMATYNKILRDAHRVMAYQNAVSTLKSRFTGPLLSVDQLKGLPRIGEGTLRRIDEIIRTGHLSDLDVLSKDPRMTEIVGVHGFGPAAALALSKKGILTIEDLKKKADSLNLNAVQKIGLKYHDSISKKIPHAEVTEHDHLLQNAVETFSGGALKLVVCGSYRRKVPTSSDVDALLTPSGPANEKKVAETKALRLDSFVEYLQCEVQYVIDRLGLGTTKFMGVASIPGGVPRRVDIRFVTHEQFAPALLYFTGSKGFNVKMRSHALEQGYMLNEYGLYVLRGSNASKKQKDDGSRPSGVKVKVSRLNDNKGTTSVEPDTSVVERVPVSSEEDIFRTIKMNYVPPEQRY